jgi:hypothetical protein
MLPVGRPRLLATVKQLQARAWLLIGAVDSAPAWEVGARRVANLPGHRWVLLRGAVLANRYPKMAARRERRGVLAVTTSGRSSAILDSKNRPLCKGLLIAAAALTYQPPDRRARTNQ